MISMISGVWTWTNRVIVFERFWRLSSLHSTMAFSFTFFLFPCLDRIKKLDNPQKNERLVASQWKFPKFSATKLVKQIHGNTRDEMRPLGDSEGKRSGILRRHANHSTAETAHLSLPIGGPRACLVQVGARLCWVSVWNNYCIGDGRGWATYISSSKRSSHKGCSHIGTTQCEIPQPPRLFECLNGKCIAGPGQASGLSSTKQSGVGRPNKFCTKRKDMFTWYMLTYHMIETHIQ